MKLWLSCKEATHLIEKQHHTSLPFSEKWALKFHLILCKVCKFYATQSKQIEQLLKKYFETQPPTEAEIEALQNRIKERL